MEVMRIVLCGLAKSEKNSRVGLWSRLRDLLPGISLRHVVEPADLRKANTDLVVFFNRHLKSSIKWYSALQSFVDVCPHPYPPLIVVGKEGKLLDRLMPARFLDLPVDRDWDGLARSISFTFQSIWWRKLFTNAPGVVVTSNGKITRVSPSCADMRSHFIGRTYQSVFENSDSELPEGHPIRAAYQRGRIVNRYYQVGNRHFYLICAPLLDLNGQSQSVAVIVVEFSKDPVFRQIMSSLAQVTSYNELLQAIVASPRILGYQRARLKQFDSIGHRLLGCCSIGLESRKEAAYKDFFINTITDTLARQALDAEFPLLFVFDKDSRIDILSKGVFRDACTLYYSKRHYEDQLEKKDVNRWIDVPLIDPFRDESDKKWGILTADRGSDSDSLNQLDVERMAILGSLASHAIGLWQNGKTGGTRISSELDVPTSATLTSCHELDSESVSIPPRLQFDSLRMDANMVPADSLSPDAARVLKSLATHYAGTPQQLECYDRLYELNTTEILKKMVRLGYAEIFNEGKTRDVIYVISNKGSVHATRLPS